MIRWQALKIIHKVEFEAEYSNVLIDRFIVHTNFKEIDKRLLVQLVYGVIQRRLTLDYYLELMLKGKKIDTWVESLLRMSIYQMIYLDKIPNHAILNDAVNIAKINGHDGLGKFVNAILRRFEREELRQLPDIENSPVEAISIKTSTPQWLVKELINWLGNDIERVEKLLLGLLDNPQFSIRVVGAAEERGTIQQNLNEEGIETEISQLSPFGLLVKKGNVLESNVFLSGKVTVQDESSMLVAPLGISTGKEMILDACSAPGGKTTHMAQLLTDGHVTALDLSYAKLNRVKEHAERMFLQDKITTFVADASKFTPKNNELYDTIYLDAPCSGLGLMRRKPEIKYQKKYDEIIELAKIQADLIRHVATLLKPGGTLVYSTCTLAPQENERLIEQFISEHSDFKINPISTNDGVNCQLLNEKGQVRIWPDQFNTDGFFICRLTKKK